MLGRIKRGNMEERLMVFVDGSNLLRATGTKIGAKIRSDKPSKEAIQLACMIIRVLVRRIQQENSSYGCKLIRKYWFGSFQGSAEYELELRTQLRAEDMEPVVFKKKQGKEKRVDLAIAREMLINAVAKNYDLGLLVAGDEDYLDLVGDLKRFGIRVIGSFYDIALSKELMLSFDHFHQLNIWGELREKLVAAVGGTIPD